MRATQQLRYAIYGVFDLAYHGGRGPVSLQEIGTRQQIPARYLEQIFQKLRRSGLVNSKRGPGGGYRLARAPEDITIADVVLAVQGCLLSVPEAPDAEIEDSPAFVWERLRAGLDRTLRSENFAQLCREAAERGVDRAGRDPVMYEI